MTDYPVAHLAWETQPSRKRPAPPLFTGTSPSDGYLGATTGGSAENAELKMQVAFAKKVATWCEGVHSARIEDVRIAERSLLCASVIEQAQDRTLNVVCPGQREPIDRRVLEFLTTGDGG
ncbi:hypothetical protein GCM10023318_35620 [Nocardia callitridis]|uniref:Uncharacterized protein n=1 Tax=Nocardia callitridis TaxID=648753 RepID=A0ABP9KHV5_9NOCA